MQVISRIVKNYDLVAVQEVISTQGLKAWSTKLLTYFLSMKS